MLKKSQYKNSSIIQSIVVSATIMVIILYFFIPFITEQYTIDTIVKNTKNSVDQIKLTRAYYVQSVVKDIKEYAPNLSFSYKHEGVNGVLPLPTTLVHNLSTLFSESTGQTYRLYSEYPFKNRKDRQLTPFQKQAIKFTQEDEQGMYIKRDVIDNQEVLRIATTDYMTSKACVSCHNTHPDRTWERGHWQLGDKRGVLEVIVPMDKELAAHAHMRNYILFVIILVAVGMLYLLHILRTKERVTEGLEIEVEQLHDMIDKHVIVSKSDTRGIITFASQAFVNISGYSKEELLGQPHSILRHPEMPSQTFKELWHTIQSGHLWSGDLINRKKDGSSYYVQANIFPLFNKKNEIVEYMAVREDITKRTLSQKALNKERQLHNIIMDNQQSILLLTSKEQGVLSVNRKLFEVFAFEDFEAFKTKHLCICELFIEREGYLKQSKETLNWLEPILANPTDVFKALMQDKWGQERIYSVQVKDVVLENKTFYVSTFTDITELEHARERAESSEKAKTEFLANMSHEIRTPMNGISGFLQLLRNTTLTVKQKEYVTIIESSMKSLLEIIQNILDFSKLDSGEMELNPVAVNPHKTFKKALEHFNVVASKKGITYSINIDKRIGQCLYIDTLRIVQVLTSLVSNAIKFTPEQGAIDVDIICLEETDKIFRIYFCVSDTGIGIPKEKQEEIFGLFTQADTSTTRKFGGTGLGLNISAALVNILGGSLELESKSGKGSRLFFELKVDKCQKK